MFVLRYVSSFLFISLGEQHSLIKRSAGNGDFHVNSSDETLHLSNLNDTATQARINSKNFSPSMSVVILNNTVQNSNFIRPELIFYDGQTIALNRTNQRSKSRKVNSSLSRQDTSFESIQISAAVA